MPPEVFKRLAVGTAVATLAAGGTPLLDASLKTKVGVMWVGVLGGLSYAEGPGKWPEGAIIAVVIAAIAWVCWTALSWIVRGFKGKGDA